MYRHYLFTPKLGKGVYDRFRKRSPGFINLDFYHPVFCGGGKKPPLTDGCFFILLLYPAPFLISSTTFRKRWCWKYHAVLPKHQLLVLDLLLSSSKGFRHKLIGPLPRSASRPKADGLWLMADDLMLY